MDDIFNLKQKSPSLFYFLRGIRRAARLKKIQSFSTQQLMDRDALLFRQRLNRSLDWSDLTSYNEKLQWEKLFNVNDIKVLLSDKFLVRDWVDSKIGPDYLIPLIGTWINAKDINFEVLPKSFVLKTNCASGDVVIVRNKETLTKRDIKGIRSKLNFYLKYNWGFETNELHYSEIPPRIVAEELLPTDDTDVPDYKFTCFDGEPYCCRVDIGRYHDHRRNTYDLEWNLQPWNAGPYPNTDYDFPKPKNFELMIDLARKLSKGFPQVRVDFYNIDGKIYFGEMTFTSGSGLEPIVPENMDYELGKLWKQDCKVPEEYL